MRKPVESSNSKKRVGVEGSNKGNGENDSPRKTFYNETSTYASNDNEGGRNSQRSDDFGPQEMRNLRYGSTIV